LAGVGRRVFSHLTLLYITPACNAYFESSQQWMRGFSAIRTAGGTEAAATVVQRLT
jgi:hypothetical protein